MATPKNFLQATGVSVSMTILMNQMSGTTALSLLQQEKTVPIWQQSLLRTKHVLLQEI